MVKIVILYILNPSTHSYIKALSQPNERFSDSFLSYNPHLGRSRSKICRFALTNIVIMKPIVLSRTNVDWNQTHAK